MYYVGHIFQQSVTQNETNTQCKLIENHENLFILKGVDNEIKTTTVVLRPNQL